MKRKVRFFRQHSLETCGISCMLMVLDAFGKVLYPTEKQERKLYGIYRCRVFKGTLASAIADCLSANGLNVAVYHSSRRFLDNQNGYFPEPLYQAMLAEYMLTLQKSYTKGLLTLLTHRETSEAPAYFYRSCGRHP